MQLRSTTALLVAGLVAAGIGCAHGHKDDAALNTQRVPSHDQRVDAVWNVLDFGATADGATDNTAAFQAALDAARDAGGGIVRIPTGRYAFDGALEVPMAVQLEGIFAYAPAHAGIRDKTEERPEYGTVLMPRGGVGEETGTPFITLSTNSTLRGVCIYYPDQDPDAAEPTPYPFAIAMRGNNPAVVDVELLNPYQGIDASRNQRALVRNVHGQPIAIGIYVDVVYDIGRIENVHWNPWWSLNTPLFNWQLENGRGFVFGRTDWHYVHNTFCFGYGIGYHFVESEHGVANGNFLGIGADRCMTALQVDQSAPFGLLITNGEFVSFDPPHPTQVRVGPQHAGVLRLVNCAFWGPTERIAVIEGTGTVGFSDCTFHQWGHHGPHVAAIDARGGSVLIRGCDFHEDKPQIRLGPGVGRGIVADNLMRGDVRIQNEAGDRVVLRDNLGG